LGKVARATVGESARAAVCAEAAMTTAQATTASRRTIVSSMRLK
jgi:hypothetical protein